MRKKPTCSDCFLLKVSVYYRSASCYKPSGGFTVELGDEDFIIYPNKDGEDSLFINLRDRLSFQFWARRCRFYDPDPVDFRFYDRLREADV